MSAWLSAPPYVWDHRTQGFTLLELLIVLAIVSILMTQAVPAMSRQLTDLSLKATARELRGAVMYARLHSQRAGTSVYLCPPTGTNPVCSRIKQISQSTAQVTVRDSEGTVLRTLALRHGISLRNRQGALWLNEPLVWGSDGLGRKNATLSVCSSRHRDLNWSLVINRIGRPKLVSGWGQCAV